MRAKKVNKGLSKIKKAAGYVSTFATLGILITQLVRKRKHKH